MYRRALFYGDGFRTKKNEKRAAFLFAATMAVGGMLLAGVLRVMAAPENRSAEMQQMTIEMKAEANGAAGMGIVLEAPEAVTGAPLIMIDAGHGGEDEGCSAGSVTEKDINLEIAGLVRQKLEAFGYQVIMTRENDTYIAKEERVERANNSGASAYVSIHQNTFEQPEISGIETWYDGSDESRDSRRLARLVHQETINSTGSTARELRDDAEFCVTGKTTMPSCLIETGFLSNEGDRDLLTTAEYREKVAAGIAQGISYYFEPKTMYLTFDDGPSEEYTNEILDILRKKNIKATFFVVGENVRKYPEIARRIVAEGHTIGIHCNRHVYEELYASADTYIRDFEEAYQAVLEVTGVEVKLFRFPGGSINAYNKPVREEIVARMSEKGFIYFDWNASLEDAMKNTTPQELIQNAKATSLGRKKVVMLAHDIVGNTALCMEELLDEFPEYRMEPLTEEVEAVQFRVTE